jgi:branched-chain amino acid transport system substrate-binding protein
MFNKFLLLVSLFVSFCFELSAEIKRVKIVSSLPRTGSSNAQTSTVVNGIRLALEEISGKVEGVEIVYEDLDDASPERGTWDPAIEAKNSDRAANDSEVVAYLGPYNSGATKISMPKLNQAGLVQISMGATYAGLTKPGFGEANEPEVYRSSGKINFFRVVPADDIQGAVGAKWAKEMGASSVYILNDRELYGKGIADVFNKTALKDGIKVLGFEGIDPKASNYRALATKIRALKPDLVFYGGITQTNAGQLAKDLRAAGVKAKFLVPDGCFEQAFIQAAGKDSLNGNAYITFGGVPAKLLPGKGQEFYTNYKKKYNSEPEGYAAYGYEAAKVVLNSLQKVLKSDNAKTLNLKSLRSALLHEVSQVKDYEGVLGIWSFDKNGDTTLTTMSGNTVESGDFKFVKLLDYSF